ncbi:tetratricopeptide repeat protein [Candidatus Omnitrophota bacterium]
MKTFSMLVVIVLYLSIALCSLSDAETTLVYEEIMESKRIAAESAFNKALSFESQGEAPKAIDAYKQAIRLNPTVKEAYNNLAAIYADLGIYDKAMLNYKKAVELDSGYSTAWYNLGMIYYSLERYDDAIDSFEKGSEGAPYSKDVLYFLGRAYCHMEKYSESIESFQAVISHDTEFYPAHFDIACVYMITNKFNDALFHFNKVLLIAPHHQEAERIQSMIKNIQKLNLEKVELRSSVSAPSQSN